MSAEEKRICRTCGTALAPHDEFCPVCAFRGALKSDETATEPSDPEPEASRFGHYEILRHDDGSLFELGRGAMGITYKAFDVDLRRFAALKVISPRYLADEAARSRFLREARAAGSVRHPNVASVFQLGTSQERYFYAMEFVEGETLGTLIKRSNGLDAKLALQIVAQVAAGLEAIHKQNLVHRDIKPSNIMVSSAPDGAVSVNIIDLGLAKTLTESESQVISIPGAFAGTPEFASPEQFTGTEVDIRSDLYSLGITLWQMLTGQPPFRGAPNAVMHQHLNSLLPLEKLPNVPKSVVALVEVLLRKHPARRFQTPAELSKALPTVIDAIETGQSVRKTIRVFVSSSSDVQTERNLANRIARGIAGEIDLLVSESSSDFQRLTEVDPFSENDGNENAEDQEHQKFALCLQFWDCAEQGEVRRLPDPGNFDLVVCLLGSQTSLPVHPELRLPDGAVPASTTEYEIAWAAERASRNHGLPILRVYRNQSKPSEPREDSEALGEESDTRRDFLAEWEDQRKGTTDFNAYKTLEEFEEHFRRHFRDFLADQIKQDAGPDVPGREVRRWKSSPFRGLNVFDFEHAPIFFGRANAIGEVLEALDQQRKARCRLVLIVGASGSGKSSLVRAGVLPALIQPGTIEGVRLWRRALTRPGAGGSGGDCFDALANALLDSAALPGLENPESISAVEELAAELRDNPAAVALRVRDALDNAAREWKMQRAMYLRAKEEKSRSSGTTTVSGVSVPRGPAEYSELPKARLALVVDQLEELFTSGFSTDIQQKYVSALAGLVQSGRVFILATLRSDFYSSYQQFPELTELTRPSGKVDLRPPTAYEIGNMIRLPAEAAGLQFELDRKRGQRLDEGLRDTASTTPESLPLLQHVLSLLYDKQAERGDGLLRWSDYREIGELKGALAKYAETVFATLQPDEQSAFPLVMRHLVTLGQGEEEAPNRRTAPYREFLAGGGESGKSGAKGFVDLFIAKRLFIADTDPHGEVNVSVAHEALLREWQRIREWLAENRDFLRMRDRLDSSLKLWLIRGKQNDDLLGPGIPLAEGEKLLKEFEPSLSQTQSDYVRASVAEERRQHRIRERVRYGVMAGITVALIVAIIFGLLSYRQYRRAEREKLAADHAAKRAMLASDEAQKLINFMTIDLRDKLSPIGRLDLLAEVNKKVLAYYDSFSGNDARPEVQRQQGIALTNTGDVLINQGALTDGLTAYKNAFKIRQRLARSAPDNPDFQSDLAQIDEKLGSVAEQQGNLPEAERNWRDALVIRAKLLSQSPDDPERLHSLFRISERIGFLTATQGDSATAEEHYKSAAGIGEKLISRGQATTDIQADLSLVYTRLYEVLLAKGRLDEALSCAQKSLEIRKSLAQGEPDNTGYQCDLALSLEKTGEVLSSQGNQGDAMKRFKDSLAIRERLVAKDPTNAHWQGDLSLSYEDLGRVLQGQGQFEEAISDYSKCLAIRRQLVLLDPTGTGQQRNLFISYLELGQLQLGCNKLTDASTSFFEALSICRKLAKQDPSNKRWQRDLAFALLSVGDVLKEQGQMTDALRMYIEAQSIRVALAALDSTNLHWQTDLAWSRKETGEALMLIKNLPDAEAELNMALTVYQKAIDTAPDNVTWENDLATIYEKLGELFLTEDKLDSAEANFRSALSVATKLLATDPKDVTAATTLSIASLRVTRILNKDNNSNAVEIRNILVNARDALLSIKQDTALSAKDAKYLEAIKDALNRL